MEKAKEKPAAKKSFKMPHLFWIMLGLLVVASILTYIVPAGQFATDAEGNVLGDSSVIRATRPPSTSGRC